MSNPAAQLREVSMLLAQASVATQTLQGQLKQLAHQAEMASIAAKKLTEDAVPLAPLDEDEDAPAETNQQEPASNLGPGSLALGSLGSHYGESTISTAGVSKAVSKGTPVISARKKNLPSKERDGHDSIRVTELPNGHWAAKCCFNMTMPSCMGEFSADGS
jgi:hypothetical protein